jgi:hypothetical protein
MPRISKMSNSGPTGSNGAIGVSGVSGDSESQKRREIIRKWRPIVTNNIGVINEEIIEYTSLYCEWYLKNNRNNDAINLNDRLSEINSRIKNPIRIDIVGKSYNPVSGLIEYKLSNGTYIPILGGVSKISDEQLVWIFDIEFIKEIDIQLYRDLKIDKII